MNNENLELKFCIDCINFTRRFNPYGDCVHPKNESLVDKSLRHEPLWLREDDEHCGPRAKWFCKNLERLHLENLIPDFDWDEYHEAIKTYRELYAGEIAILYINNFKYVKINEEEKIK